MDPIDTRAEACLGDDMVLAAISQWSPQRRSMAQARLTALVRRARHPDLTPLAADVAWAESQYGPVIGAALRRWLNARG